MSNDYRFDFDDRINRIFMLWAKICMMISDGKRKAETVSRHLSNYELAPPIEEPSWGRTLMAQWHFIVGNLLDLDRPEVEGGWWHDDSEKWVCMALQDILEMKLGRTKNCYVQFRNVMNNPPAYDLVCQEIGHEDFEIVDVEQQDRVHLGAGVLTYRAPQSVIPALVKYREIKWPERKKQETAHATK